MVAFVGQIEQRDVTNYGIQFGLNVALGGLPAPAMPVKAPRS